MSVQSHIQLGQYRPTISTTEWFNPIPYCFDPARVEQIKAAGRARFIRDMREPRDLRFSNAAAAFRKLPKKMRRAAIQQAGETTFSRFLDADYAKAKITADEPCRAALWAVGYCSAAHWQDDANGERNESRGTMPGAGRSMASSGENPAGIAAAIESARSRYPSALQTAIAQNTARSAIIGGGEEIQIVDGDGCHVIPCPGGSVYLESSRMVSTTTRTYFIPGEGTQEWNGEEKPFRYRQAQRPGGWKMETRKAHRATEYPAGVARIVGDDTGNGAEYVG
jgi:hypothetical protein